MPRRARKRQTSRGTATERDGVSYNSRLEAFLAGWFVENSLDLPYEDTKIQYVPNPKPRTYTPDFRLGQVLFEVKGYFPAEDRKKYLDVLTCNPELDLRFILANPQQKINRSSSTSVASWLDKKGLLWCQGPVYRNGTGYVWPNHEKFLMWIREILEE